MYRIQLDPGPWQQYVKRADNIGLPLHEVSKKYIMESNLYATQLFEALQQSPVSVAGPASGGGSAPAPAPVNPLPSNCIEFVVDTTNTDYFAFSFNTTGPINFTIEWGDGTTHDDSGFGGFYEETHTYPETGKQYTARICFDDPSIVTELDFYGND